LTLPGFSKQIISLKSHEGKFIIVTKKEYDHKGKLKVLATLNLLIEDAIRIGEFAKKLNTKDTKEEVDSRSSTEKHKEN